MQTPDNHLILAVAGSRKTQGIVDACATADPAERILILTYTTANQVELKNRLSTAAGDHHHIEVTGWFTFLIGHFVRPFLPFVYRGKRVRGFDFDSPPQTYIGAGEWSRYFNSRDQVRKVHLPQLACLVDEASGGAAIRRLERIYDRIYIDEVQDLCGYDLEILTLLMASALPIEMVGDIRQAILATNGRERKNKKYMYMQVWDWFRKEERAGRLRITQRCETWRCRPEVAAFADSLFGSEWGFEATVSLNQRTTGHDGVFLVRSSDVNEYVDEFAPLTMRYSAGSASQFDHLDPMNFGMAKGLGRERVLICPTDKITKHLKTGTALDQGLAAHLYVSVTRAEQSVAFVIDSPGACAYPYWSPEGAVGHQGASGASQEEGTEQAGPSSDPSPN